MKTMNDSILDCSPGCLRITFRLMTGKEVDERLRKLGKTRAWLATATEKKYRPETLRDALAPNSRNGISPKMAAEIEKALSHAEASQPPAPGDILGEFTAKERQVIVEQASREGFAGPHAWMVAKIRALLTMFGAGPK